MAAVAAAAAAAAAAAGGVVTAAATAGARLPAAAVRRRTSAAARQRHLSGGVLEAYWRRGLLEAVYWRRSRAVRSTAALEWPSHYMHHLTLRAGAVEASGSPRPGYAGGPRLPWLP